MSGFQDRNTNYFGSLANNFHLSIISSGTSVAIKELVGCKIFCNAENKTQKWGGIMKLKDLSKLFLGTLLTSFIVGCSSDSGSNDGFVDEFDDDVIVDCSVRFTKQATPKDHFAGYGYMFTTPGAYSTCRTETNENGNEQVTELEGYPYLNVYKKIFLGVEESLQFVNEDSRKFIYIPIEFEEWNDQKAKDLAELMGALNIQNEEPLFNAEEIESARIRLPGYPVMPAYVVQAIEGDLKLNFLKIDAREIGFDFIKDFRTSLFMGNQELELYVLPKFDNSEVAFVSIKESANGNWRKTHAAQFAKANIDLSYKFSEKVGWLQTLNQWLSNGVIEDIGNAQFDLRELTDQGEKIWSNPTPFESELNSKWNLEMLKYLEKVNSRTPSKIYFDEFKRFELSYGSDARLVYEKVVWLAEKTSWTTTQKDQFMNLFMGLGVISESNWIKAEDLIRKYGFDSPKIEQYTRWNQTLSNITSSKRKRERIVNHYIDRTDSEDQFTKFIEAANFFFQELNYTATRSLDLAIDHLITENMSFETFDAIKSVILWYKSPTSPIGQYASNNKMLREAKKLIVEKSFNATQVLLLQNVNTWMRSKQGLDWYESKAYKESLEILELGLVEKEFVVIKRFHAWMIQSKGGNLYASKAFRMIKEWYKDSEVSMEQISLIEDLARFFMNDSRVGFYGSKAIRTAKETIIDRGLNESRSSFFKSRVKHYLNQGQYGSRAVRNALEDLQN